MAGEELINRMRGKRNVAAVLKIRLASIRAQASDALVFVVEGPEDKTVYFHWLKQLAPLLKHEMLVCNGKGKLLAFRELLQGDLGGLKTGVYFLIDHDFDGLRGQAPVGDIYVTDTYAVENHLVTEHVLDQILRVELHCDGEPAARSSVLNHFNSLYSVFLEVTRPLNHRIFLARRIGIRNARPWPDKINSIAKVSLEAISPADESLESQICLEREPSQEEVAALETEFESLSPRERYRGKFAMAFFAKFIQQLSEDRAADSPKLFPALKPQPCNGGVALDAIASKSSAPLSFKEFITSILVTMQAPPLVAA
jgi:hypothetical protein